MKKTLIYSLVAVLILCAGIAVGMNFNKQKNTPDSTPEKEVAPEEIEYSDNEVLSDKSKAEVEYLTSEDKEWVFQETYDNTQQMIKDQGGSDSQCFEAELDDLPIYLDYYKETFNGRVSPGIDVLKEEYKTWRIEKYGDGTSSKSEVSKPAETTQQQKPSSTQTQQKPSSTQNNSNNSENSTSSLGDLYTPGIPGYHDPDPYEGMTPEEREAAIQRDIQATEEACKNSGDYVFN